MGAMRVARISGVAAPEDRSDRELQPLTCTCNAVIALPSIAAISDPVAAERSPLCGTFAAAGHCNHPSSTTGVELNRMQLDADPVVQSACNTIVDDMPGTAAQRQLAAVHRNDTSSARNAYPAFSLPAALLGADTRQSLALFVHRNALLTAGKATKRRPIAAKTTRKRKQSESVSRCGICAR